MSLQRVLDYYLTEITDNYIRENFQRIREFLRDDPVQKTKFEFFKLNTRDIDEGASYPITLEPQHFLSFQPRDVILLSVVDSDQATVTWNYDDFNSQTISLTASAACTIRALVGRYEES